MLYGFGNSVLLRLTVPDSESADARVALPADDDPDGLDRLVADNPEAVRRRGIECDRVPRGEVILVEADAHAETACDHVRELATAVRDQRVRRARLAADVVPDPEELDLRIAVRRQPLPGHPGLEVDHRALVGIDHRPLRVRRPASGMVLSGEEVAHGQAELGDERVERAHA